MRTFTATPTARAAVRSPPAYAELHCATNFSFLKGASHPGELVDRALALGYTALAITDDCSMAGVVRAHLALRDARKHPDTAIAALAFKLIVGSEFTVRHGDGTPLFRLVLLACHREGYGLLCEFITRLRRSSAHKGHYHLTLPMLDEAAGQGALADCLALLAPLGHDAGGHRPDADALDTAMAWLQHRFAGDSGVLLELHHDADDAWWLGLLQELTARHSLPLVAAGDVHMHVRSRKPLQDVLTATRLNTPLHQAGWALQRHAERHLRSRVKLALRHPAAALNASVAMAARCHFSLDELRYEYPQEVVPAEHTPASWLRQLTEGGLRQRYPLGVPGKVQSLIEHELALIAELGYEPYFLTVHDIVHFARSRGILCQGRGSAANSAVCYALGITEVDPDRSTLLFERFISRERNEPPDIDVDFEHQRREEVIQYLYQKYGRDRAALTATVTSYRTRSAVRDVGRALGLDAAEIELVASNLQWWDSLQALPERLQEAGFDPESLRIRQWIELTRTLIGFPRHLGQHTGGFVISQGALCRMVPIENAAMPDRSVIQWDKDDLDALGLLKVDVLALGMLTALHRSIDLIGLCRGRSMRLQDIPPEDPRTYDMICQADTVGVFQIESRAQMNMLPRLRPRSFYDLVVEVALVRPGPIQGGMVHPYLRRRQGLEPIDVPHGLEAALERTLGVPIFQEQVMQVAVLAAGFSPGEADGLRRSMAAWKRSGGVHQYQKRILQGMTERGHSAEFAHQIFKQIEGFGSYGFPESHAASFALLVYASAWVKCHEPAAFLAGLLNAQPLGFYTPSQLIQDAQRHGVTVLPADVQHSGMDSHLVLPCGPHEQAPVRLGLRLVGQLSGEGMARLVQARQDGPFTSVADVSRRADLSRTDLQALAAADALRSLSGHRRQQAWEAAGQQRMPPLLQDAAPGETTLLLTAPPEAEDIVQDHRSMGLSLRRHPLALLRPTLAQHKLLSAQQLHDFPNGRLARACGLVTVRQQPSTASGVVFVTLEDETGTVNVIVWRSLRDRQREALVQSRLLAVYGVWQREGEVRNLIAHRLNDLSPLLGDWVSRSRDFH